MTNYPRNYTSDSTELTIEHRRPGLWIVCACTASLCGLLFTVEIGQDQSTFDYRYRVSSTYDFGYFPNLPAAIEFCRSFAGHRTGRAH